MGKLTKKEPLPDDCQDCPHGLDERVSGVDYGFACGLAGGPTKVCGENGLFGEFFTPPDNCPLRVDARREAALDGAAADIRYEYTKDDKE